MGPERFTTDSIDYLQRAAYRPPELDGRAAATRPHPASRQLLRVRGVGYLEKDALPRPGETFRLVSEDLLVALYNYKIALALVISAGRGGLDIGIGSWIPGGAPGADASQTLGANVDIMSAALASLYPSVDVSPMFPDDDLVWSHAGLVIGVPSAKPPETLDGSLPVDRLLRAMSGSAPWSVLVLAQPMPEQATQQLRLQILNEMRAVTGAAAGTGQRPPSQHYVELLKVALENLTKGQGGGLWRTAVYLTGSETTYYRLASVWRGIFSGPASMPEPVRVFDDATAADLARTWALPDPVALTPPPGHVRHPFSHQTPLTSTQLAAYVHLPRLETRGFAVTLVPDFDVEPAPTHGERLVLGRVVERNRPGSSMMAVGRDALTSHAFVTGVTGAGKTTTIKRLLEQADEVDIPFLVIEPAKAEYRALLDHPRIGPRLRVFTPGNEMVAPMRLNPFAFPAGIPVGVHLDLLRSVFHTSLGMWTPLPQVLERCLHAVYSDRGWNVTTDSNHRLSPGEPRHPAFPTLSDLIAKVDEVVGGLGYDERVAADVRAALKTRLGSLRTGGKGRMLDVGRSTSLIDLLQVPAVLELEGLGDDDDKAFVMGLLLIRLAEERRVGGPSRSLRHLVVFEEAHRLLADPGAGRGEAEADVRGKAVETFANLLSEVRAYGEGVVIADQVPTKLARDVMKNTGLKVAHRIVAGDDRTALASAMAMTERQQRALATLPRGRAAVYVEGEDVPLLVDIDPGQSHAATAPVDDERVRQQALALADAGDALDADGCGEDLEACEAARRTLDDQPARRTLARMTLSALFDPEALERRWEELTTVANIDRPGHVDRDAHVRALAHHGAHWIAARRGAQEGWGYADTSRFADALADLMATRAHEIDPAAAWAALSNVVSSLDSGIGPFPGCARIWQSADPPCRCRWAVADLLASGQFDSGWRHAQGVDSQGDSTAAAWTVCQEIAYHAIEFPDARTPDESRSAHQRRAIQVGLCAGQQLIARDQGAHPRSQALAIDRLIQEARGG